MVKDVAIGRQRAAEQTETGIEKSMGHELPPARLSATPVPIKKSGEDEVHTSAHVMNNLRKHLGISPEMTVKDAASADFNSRIAANLDRYGVKFGLLKNFNEMLALSALL